LSCSTSKKGGQNCGKKDILGIDNFDPTQLGISVYPNPVLDHIFIESQNEQIEHILLLDLAGKVVVRNNIQTNSYRLDLGFIKPGIYILRVTSDYGEKSVKIILQ